MYKGRNKTAVNKNKAMYTSSQLILRNSGFQAMADVGLIQSRKCWCTVTRTRYLVATYAVVASNATTQPCLIQESKTSCQVDPQYAKNTAVLRATR